MTPSTTPRLTPLLMFEGSAEEALGFYVSLFDDGRVRSIVRWGPGEAGTEGTVRHATATLAGQLVRVIDSSASHELGFTPALSLHVACRSEEEIDRLYAALVEHGNALMPLGAYGLGSMFGWVNDRFGVSWQLQLPEEEGEPARER